MSFATTLLGLVLLIGTSAVVSLESGLFVRWFGVASVVLALISIVGAFAIGYATTTWILAAAVIAVGRPPMTFAKHRPSRVSSLA